MGLLWSLLPRGATAAVPVIPGMLRAGMRVGPWRVVRPLGSGGNGAVYLVKRWGRHYALKLAVRPGDPRLEREGRLLRRLRHPGVVKLHGRGWWLGRRKGFPYLVMEYVEGLSLYEWARQSNPTPGQVAELLAQAALAVDAVHQERAVHRDVKGSNTLVLPGGRRLVLVDLGAGDYEGATSLTSQVLPPGTEVYLSPEAMAFAWAHAREPGARYEAGPADDLYALGVMAHRVLTDEYPFPVHVPRDLFWAMVERRPAPSAREVNPRVPAALAAIVQRLLSKRPEERYARGREVAEAFREAAAEGAREWGEPLFEWYSEPGPASRTTQEVAPAGPLASGPEVAARVARMGPGEWQQWMRECSRLRKRPLAVAQGAEAAPVPELPAPAPERVRNWRTVGGWLALTLALAVGVAALTRIGVSLPPDDAAHTRSDSQALPTQEVGGPGQEVARAALSPDAGTGAAPAEASTSAPVAPATKPKEDIPVKKPAMSTNARNQKEQSPPSKSPPASGGRLAKALPLCVGLACTSGQQALRPTPPPEACPPGALQAMSGLGITVGDEYESTLFVPEADPAPITVKEGRVTVALQGAFRGLPYRTELSGRLVFGERVHGRMTVARLPDERTLPVCIELWDLMDDANGLQRLPESTEDSVKVFSLVGVRAVDRFK